MGMGNFDETEHERREAKQSNVDATSDDTRTQYRGSVSYDSGESTEALLDQFERIQSE